MSEVRAEGGAANGGEDLRPVLRRWEDAGGTWQLVARSATSVTVALCRCDGGEEVDRLTSSHPASVRQLAAGGPS